MKSIPSLITQYKDIFVCPICDGNLTVRKHREVKCSKCNRIFGSEKGIPMLFWSNEWNNSRKDVTDVIKSFYEKTPFPNYEELDSRLSLRNKSEKGIFARLLDDQIPYGAKILEVGCGTGQLSNFLGMTSGRTVFAVDMCLNSLKLGQEFKEKNQIDNVAFLQMNLFRPVFKPCSFDLVICNGVLHHTGDPFLGFQSISKLVKNEGFIIIGLYNTYGRITTDVKHFVFKLTGNRFKFLDFHLRDKNLGSLRKYTWFMDQYKNPHESKHTIGEVLNWFKRSRFEFINSIPKPTIFEPFSLKEELFKPSLKGTWFDNFLVQLSMLFSGGREGGFFIMIGKKNA